VAAVRLEAPEKLPEHVLRQADRIRHRHDHDLAAHAAFGVERGEPFLERPCGEHRGRFVGMQRSLNVDRLAVAPGVAEMKADEFARRAERRRDE